MPDAVGTTGPGDTAEPAVRPGMPGDTAEPAVRPGMPGDTAEPAVRPGTPGDEATAELLKARLSSLSPSQRAVLERSLRRRNAKAPQALGTTPRAAGSPAAAPRRTRRPGSTMEFSLFFFSGDGSADGPGKYQLLLDSARYADAHGFAGIWVPERHFVDFGGLYPNPSVLAAALAMVTERLQIRAGSAVLPLHHPVRVAEEWAVVDNLSGGRVAVSAASGWHPDDFLLAPGDGALRHERRKEEMFEAIDTVQRLWAGETVALPRADGTPQHVRTLPRPLQPRLPMWVSAQGSVETFVRAGEIGAHVLTGLVAQRPADLKDKIGAYRKARAEAGHDPAAGTVTAMVHTFLAARVDEAKEVVRGPLTAYLKTFLAQQDSFDSEFATLSDAERDAMLAATFERYFDGLALLGTPDTCESLVEDLVDIGVDEVACLVDFGLDPDRVLAGLDHLTVLKDRYRPAPEGEHP
ncbi:MupA/Atu3671 family FMN-dependent luciferase-like monooxygenase [Streptomyces roseolus]|uniref:MupA/Atu3671 family FMN-dependent luciferase-like monooxygenase n=1 Tax=Streptomyces roseolus TaxID=67358 RepID=UPI003647CA31